MAEGRARHGAAMMKAISIRQPWCWLIAEGIKPVENRNGASIAGQARASVGERVAIHASAGFDATAERQTGEVLQSLGYMEGEPTPEKVARITPVVQAIARGCGHIIATAIIDRVIEHGDGDPLNTNEWRTEDRFGIVWRDVVKVEQVPCKGALGLWTVPDGVACNVTAAMERA